MPHKILFFRLLFPTATLFKLHQGCVLGHKVPHLVTHSLHDAVLGGLDDVLHLHGNHDDERVAGLDLVAVAHVHLLDDAGHGRHCRAAAAARLWERSIEQRFLNS